MDKDKKYITTDNPLTIKRFEPSESFKNKKNTLEKKIDVITKIINDIFLDFKCI